MRQVSGVRRGRAAETEREGPPARMADQGLMDREDLLEVQVHNQQYLTDTLI